ncbi:polysaccharide deacetylase family protein [Arthrobacter gyeryongensis]|uniref:polysaccharide deacetylase family protein n=1 Tax=Arthrobacter gyeryongensis TaxID=1650592 RepID=UPI0031EB5CB4
MPSTTRDFVGYGEHPPEFRWPGASRVAVSLVINVEDGAERSIARGGPADDLGAHWIKHPVHPTVRNLTLESAFEYGSRAGIWRVLRILRRHNVRATAFCCATALEQNAQIAAALVRDGHEIADHGYNWDTHAGLAPDEERALITASRDSIAGSTGVPPTSWYSRDGLNRGTRDILAAAGFMYESNSFNDDLPHFGTGMGASALPVLPYAGDTNDSGLFTQFPTATAFAGHLCGTLDMMLTDSRSGPSVMNVGLHPRLIGRPAYATALDTFLSHASKNSAWIATRSQIIEAWLLNTRQVPAPARSGDLGTP